MALKELLVSFFNPDQKKTKETRIPETELQKSIYDFIRPTKEKIFITIALPILTHIIIESHISALNDVLNVILITIFVATLFPAIIIASTIGTNIISDPSMKSTIIIIINYYLTACIIQQIYKTAVTNHTKTNTKEEKKSNIIRFIAYLFYTTIGFFILGMIIYLRRFEIS